MAAEAENEKKDYPKVGNLKDVLNLDHLRLVRLILFLNFPLLTQTKEEKQQRLKTGKGIPLKVDKMERILNLRNSNFDI